MQRSYIICHMVTSIDDKVTGKFLYAPECQGATEVYYQINRDFGADAFACGRVTMEESFTGGWQPDLTEFEGAQVAREDYVADSNAEFFAVAFDRFGRLGWKSLEIVDEDPGYGGAHIIEVLCEEVPDRYLAYLQKVGVSYVFAGKDEMDIPLALVKLKELFGIKKMLLEGGSIINGAFMRAAVVDELSLVVASVMAGEDGGDLFDNVGWDEFVVADTKTMAENVVWKRYVKMNENS